MSPPLFEVHSLSRPLSLQSPPSLIASQPAAVVPPPSILIVVFIVNLYRGPLSLNCRRELQHVLSSVCPTPKGNCSMQLPEWMSWQVIDSDCLNMLFKKSQQQQMDNDPDMRRWCRVLCPAPVFFIKSPPPKSLQKVHEGAYLIIIPIHICLSICISYIIM